MRRILITTLLCMIAAAPARALTVTVSNATRVTATSAKLYGNIDTNATCWFYFNQTNGGPWGWYNALGACSSGAVSAVQERLAGGETYYYALYASNSSTSVWSSIASFKTLTVPSSVGSGVMADTNGHLLYPTNFFEELEGTNQNFQAQIDTLSTGKTDLATWQNTNANFQGQIGSLSTGKTDLVTWQNTNANFQGQITGLSTGKTGLASFNASNVYFEAAITDRYTKAETRSLTNDLGIATRSYADTRGGTNGIAQVIRNGSDAGGASVSGLGNVGAAAGYFGKLVTDPYVISQTNIVSLFGSPIFSTDATNLADYLDGSHLGAGCDQWSVWNARFMNGAIVDFWHFFRDWGGTDDLRIENWMAPTKRIRFGNPSIFEKDVWVNYTPVTTGSVVNKTWVNDQVSTATQSQWTAMESYTNVAKLNASNTYSPATTQTLNNVLVKATGTNVLDVQDIGGTNCFAFDTTNKRLKLGTVGIDAESPGMNIGVGLANDKRIFFNLVAGHTAGIYFGQGSSHNGRGGIHFQAPSSTTVIFTNIIDYYTSCASDTTPGRIAIVGQAAHYAATVNTNGGAIVIYGGEPNTNSASRSGDVLLATDGCSIRGKVGVGIAAPTEMLDVAGALCINTQSVGTASAVSSCKMYSTNAAGTAEMYVVDGAGNHTLFSPHLGDAWVFESLNEFTGRKISVDMEALCLALEATSGAKLMTIEWAAPARDWDLVEAQKQSLRECEISNWSNEVSNIKALTNYLDGVTALPSKPLPYTKLPKPQWLIDRLKDIPK